MVDPITEGRIQSVLAAKEISEDWWILDGMSGTNPVQRAPLGAPRLSPC